MLKLARYVRKVVKNYLGNLIKFKKVQEKFKANFRET